MTGVASVRPVSVLELQRAWRAVQAGEYRAGHERRKTVHVRCRAATPPQWEPTERVIPVLGCLGQAGASTVSLALACVAGHARVLECSTASASGLSGASTAELGPTANGWSTGRREEVLIARSGRVHLGLLEVPLPDETTNGLAVSVLDVGWEFGHVMGSSGWVREQVLDRPVVLVTTPTVPGLRRLETALTLLTQHDHGSAVVVAVVGAGRKWQRPVHAVMGPRARAVAAADRVVPVPPDRVLRIRGVTDAPLPRALLSAAENILARLPATDTVTTTVKGPL